MNFTQSDLETYWRDDIKSDLPLPKKFVDYYNNREYSLSQVLESISLDIAKEILNLYKFETIFTKQNTKDFDPFIKTINDCYQNKIFDKNFQDVLVDNSNQVPFYTAKSIYPNYQLNILYPGITYTNEYYMRTPRGVCRMEICKNNFTLAIYENYNGESKYKNTPYWNYSNGNNNTNKVYMKPDGNLIIYNSNGLQLWESGTSGNPGAYGELLQQGFFVIKASDGQIIKCLNALYLDTPNLDAYQSYASSYDFILQGGYELCSPSTYIIPGMRYTRGFSWVNGDYALIVQSDGNFVLYHTPIRKIMWQTRNTDRYAIAPDPNPNLQLKTTDGNLVLWREGIHQNNEQGRWNPVQWSSDTGGRFTYTPKIQLIPSGFLVIFNNNNNIFKAYPHDPIINFLNSVQYDPSDNKVMDFLTIYIFKLGKDRWSTVYQNQLKSEFTKK
jgi:hypothetical protein